MTVNKLQLPAKENAVQLKINEIIDNLGGGGSSYTGGTGISIDANNAINHSNSVTAGTAGTSSATSGSTLSVPYVTYDAQGHITATGTHTHTVTGFSTTDTKYTACSYNTNSKIYLIGATSQGSSTSTGTQTYSNNSVYAQNGYLYATTPASTTNNTIVATTAFVKAQGYTSNVGTVTSVNNTSPDSNGNVTISIPSTAGFEQTANKVTSITSSSTNTEYPSAKSVIALLKTIYPVGCVYLTTNSTCPLSSLFGTWSLVSSGKALWTGTGSNGDSTISAGLPNITGSFRRKTYNTDTTTTNMSGAFTMDGSFWDTGVTPSGTNKDANGIVNFNASLSNSIYGNSTTVQPPAYVVNVFRRTA